MTWRPRWFGFLGALILAWALTRVPGRSIVSSGTEAWDDTAPQAAIEAWQTDTGRMPWSPTTLYNLGVAYWHAGDTPRAIAYWREARRYLPRNPDLAHNLALVRGELEGVPRPIEPTYGWMAWVTPGEVGVFAGLFWLLAGWAWMGTARRREPPPWVGTALLASAVALTALSMAGRQALLITSPGVVRLDEAILREAPELTARTRGRLPRGTEVRVAREAGTFALVEAGNGKRGWVLTGALARAERP